MHKMPYMHLNYINILHLKLSKVLALIVKVVNVSCNATVMELVDMRDSKSLAFGRGGSSPPTGTTLTATD